MNSIHSSLKEVLSDDEFIDDLAKKIQEKIILKTEDRAISVEVLDSAKFDIVMYEIDKLISRGANTIVVRGIQVL